MKYLTSNEIRLIWLEFFRKKGHEILPSASLIPQNDKSILWVVAGVAPLKKYFDGSQIPLNKKMANVQKCIRTNDIENVGLTARHHTFFEMLGFFSIGDYFKKEAIEYAYELMFSQVYFGFDLSKIYITYYPSDVDCLNTWLKLGIKKERLLPKESNYWEIGEGPSGPNCEIFFDRGEEYSTINIESGIINDIENDRYIELINIVFSQYNAKVGVKRCEYKLLPNKNIDTGAGLERFACILQNVPTNFDTDLFLPIVHGIAKILNVSYENQKNIKIIADHIRTITMAINDGAVFANEGRGYILRRLLRRALKCAYEMGTKEPFLSHIVEIVINQMNIFYDFASVDIIKNLVYKEEVRFLATIDAGYKMLNEFKKQNTLAIDAKTVFKLYETYGFPIELTKEFASENNIQIDEEGFFKLFKEHQDKSRDISDNYGNMGSQNQEYLDFKNESNFTYDSLTTNSKVIKVFSSGVVLDITPFYATSGGQVCDIGTINNYNVVNVIKLPHKQHLHVISHHLNEGDDVVCNVDEKTRFETTKNHSATHLLHFALKHILGQHVTQQGSFVNHEVLRFDFNHFV